jgi:hypothetical protein
VLHVGDIQLVVIYSGSLVLQMGNTAEYKGGNTRTVTYVIFISFITETVI